MARIFFAKPTVYIEIADTVLMIATMHRMGSNYQFKHVQTYPLTMLEVINGVIFNPSQLFTLIGQGLSALSLVPAHCNAILSLPNISQTNTTPAHCIALQATLCAAKTGLTIVRVIATSLYNKRQEQPINQKALKQIPNLLQLFQAPAKPAHSIAVTGALLLFIGICYYCFDKTIELSKELGITRTEIEQLTSNAAKLQKTAGSSDEIRKNIQTTQTDITTIQKFLANHRSYAPILQMVSKQIPDSVVLTSLELGRQRRQTDKKNSSLGKQSITNIKTTKQLSTAPLVLKGLANNADQVILFNKALGALGELKNVKLTALKKIKRSSIKMSRKKNPFRYGFTLHASLMPT